VRGAVFRYEGFDLDASARTLTCHYSLDGDRFHETVDFPDGRWDDERVRAAARLIFLLAGVSYYKAGAPPRVEVDEPLATHERAFLESFFVNGLAEFAYGNGIDLSALEMHAPTAPDRPAAPGAAEGSRVLVPFGGGMDSIVTAELMKPVADVALFIVSRGGDRFDAIEQSAAATGLPIVRAERELDPKVLASEAHGYLNGHVPVTGILSAIAVMAAVLDDRAAVVMSNEWSASIATIEHRGRPVNHQWSKGIDFERDFRALVPVEYFSRLRPSSEYWIAQQFATLDRYHGVFRSCNRAFHTDPARRLDHWCGHCDKCCFIDLILAPFLDRDALAGIFGGNEPLDNTELRPQFDALLGTGDAPRPFECIGDVGECRTAAVTAARRPDRRGTAMLKALAADAEATGRVPDPSELLRPLGPHFIPAKYATEALVV
jgi:hypothetical protein